MSHSLERKIQVVILMAKYESLIVNYNFLHFQGREQTTINPLTTIETAMNYSKENVQCASKSLF